MGDKRTVFNKCISIITVSIFIFTSTAAYAGPLEYFKKFADNQQQNQQNTAQKNVAEVDTAAPKGTSPFVVPENVGLIKDEYVGKSGKAIIHIQDAHCNFEAQSNIVKILQNATEQRDIKLIAVEGSSGAIDTSLFTTFPDKSIREEVSTYFMRKGKISGAEYFAINMPGDSYLHGVETREYYLENLKAFTDSLPLKEDARAASGEIDAWLKKLKRDIYSPELKKFDLAVNRYESGKTTFTNFVEYLKIRAGEQKLDLAEYKNFNLFLQTISVEKSIDFDKVDQERTRFIETLDKVLAKEELSELFLQSLYYKLGQISANSYYSQIKEIAHKHRIDMAKYPGLKSYINYLALYNKVDNKELFAEISKIKDGIAESLFQNDTQRQLARLVKHIDMIANMIDISMGNEDMRYYFDNKEDFASDAFVNFIKTQSVNLGFNFTPQPAWQIVDEIQPTLNKFYTVAEKRDDAIIKNTLAKMDDDNADIAVLITGGYHTEGLTRRLKDHDISYYVVSPRITKEDTNNPYMSILSNQRTPFEQLLAEGTAAIALRSYLASQNWYSADEQRVFISEVGAVTMTMAGQTNPEGWLLSLEAAGVSETTLDVIDSVTVRPVATNLTDPTDIIFQVAVPDAGGENVHTLFMNVASLDHPGPAALRGSVLQTDHGKSNVVSIARELPDAVVPVTFSSGQEDDGGIYIDTTQRQWARWFGANGDCGAFCKVGTELTRQEAIDFAYESMARTEHRGYDSMGVAFVVRMKDGSHKILQKKVVGGKDRMKPLLESEEFEAQFTDVDAVVSVYGHTRWATHGHPSESNQHPILAGTGDVGVVFNGVVENYVEIDQWLAQQGDQYKRPEDVQTDAFTIETLIRYYMDQPSDAAVAKRAQIEAGSPEVTPAPVHVSKAIEFLKAQDKDEDKNSLFEAVQKAKSRLEGDYAIWAFSSRDPGTGVFTLRGQKPQSIGYGALPDKPNYAHDPAAGYSVASEASVGADGPKGHRGYQRNILSDQIAVVTADGVEVYTPQTQGEVTTYKLIEGSHKPNVFVDTRDIIATKLLQKPDGGEEEQPYFTIKEIMQGPQTFRDTINHEDRVDRLRRRIAGENVGPLGLPDEEFIANTRGVVIVGMGTASYAGGFGEHILNTYVGKSEKPFLAKNYAASELYDKLTKEMEEAITLYHQRRGEKPPAKFPTDVETWISWVDIYKDTAFKFLFARYEGMILVAVSQSGSTQDTNEPVALAQAFGAKVIGMVNKPGDTTLIRMADFIFRTMGGVEVGVASTKAFVNQVAAFHLMGLYFGLVRGTLTAEETEQRLDELVTIPDKMEAWLQDPKNIERVREWAERASRAPYVTYLGRNDMVYGAKEAALKNTELKSVSDGGESSSVYKHGPMTVISRTKYISVWLATNSHRWASRKGNEEEVLSRYGQTWKIVREGDFDRENTITADGRSLDELGNIITVPDTSDDTAIFTTILPIQLLAVYTAEEIGRNGLAVQGWAEDLFKKYVSYKADPQNNPTGVIAALERTRSQLAAWTEQGRFNIVPAEETTRTLRHLDEARHLGEELNRAQARNENVEEAREKFNQACAACIDRLRGGDALSYAAYFNRLLEAHDKDPSAPNTLDQETAGVIRNLLEDFAQTNYSKKELPLGESDPDDPMSTLLDRLLRINNQLSDQVVFKNARANFTYDEGVNPGLGARLDRNIDKPADIAKEMTVDTLELGLRDRLNDIPDAAPVLDEVFRGTLSLAANGRIDEFRGVVPIVSELTGVSQNVVRRRAIIHERAHFILRQIPNLSTLLVALREGIAQIDQAGIAEAGLDYATFRDSFEEVFGRNVSETHYLEEVLVKYISARLTGQGMSLFAPIQPVLDEIFSVELDWPAEFRNDLANLKTTNMTADELAAEGVLPKTLDQLFSLDFLQQYRDVSDTEQNAEKLKLLQLTPIAEAMGMPLGINARTHAQFTDERIAATLRGIRHWAGVTEAEVGATLSSGAESEDDRKRALGIINNRKTADGLYFVTEHGSYIRVGTNLFDISPKAKITDGAVIDHSIVMDGARVIGGVVRRSIVEKNSELVYTDVVDGTIVRNNAKAINATLLTNDAGFDEHPFFADRFRDIRRKKTAKHAYALRFKLTDNEGKRLSISLSNAQDRVKETAQDAGQPDFNFRVRTEIGAYTDIGRGTFFLNVQTGDYVAITGRSTDIENSVIDGEYRPVGERTKLEGVRMSTVHVGKGAHLTGSEWEEAYIDEGFRYEERVDEGDHRRQTDSYMVGVFSNVLATKVFDEKGEEQIGWASYLLNHNGSVFGSRIVVADYGGEENLSTAPDEFSAIWIDPAAVSEEESQGGKKFGKSVHMRGVLFTPLIFLAPDQAAAAGALAVNARTASPSLLKTGPKDNVTSFGLGAEVPAGAVTGRSFGRRTGLRSSTETLTAHIFVQQPIYSMHKILQSIPSDEVLVKKNLTFGDYRELANDVLGELADVAKEKGEVRARELFLELRKSRIFTIEEVDGNRGFPNWKEADFLQIIRKYSEIDGVNADQIAASMRRTIQDFDNWEKSFTRNPVADTLEPNEPALTLADYRELGDQNNQKGSVGSKVQEQLRQRKNTFVHPSAIIEDGYEIGENVFIGPGVRLEGRGKIADGSYITYTNARDFSVGENSHVSYFKGAGVTFGNDTKAFHSRVAGPTVFGDGNRLRHAQVKGVRRVGHRNKFDPGAVVTGYDSIGDDNRFGHIIKWQARGDGRIGSGTAFPHLGSRAYNVNAPEIDDEIYDEADPEIGLNELIVETGERTTRNNGSNFSGLSVAGIDPDTGKISPDPILLEGWVFTSAGIFLPGGAVLGRRSFVKRSVPKGTNIPAWAFYDGPEHNNWANKVQGRPELLLGPDDEKGTLVEYELLVNPRWLPLKFRAGDTKDLRLDLRLNERQTYATMAEFDLEKGMRVLAKRFKTYGDMALAKGVADVANALQEERLAPLSVVPNANREAALNVTGLALGATETTAQNALDLETLRRVLPVIGESTHYSRINGTNNAYLYPRVIYRTNKDNNTVTVVQHPDAIGTGSADAGETTSSGKENKDTQLPIAEAQLALKANSRFQTADRKYLEQAGFTPDGIRSISEEVSRLARKGGQPYDLSRGNALDTFEFTDGTTVANLLEGQFGHVALPAYLSARELALLTRAAIADRSGAGLTGPILGTDLIASRYTTTSGTDTLQIQRQGSNIQNAMPELGARQSFYADPASIENDFEVTEAIRTGKPTMVFIDAESLPFNAKSNIQRLIDRVEAQNARGQVHIAVVNMNQDLDLRGLLTAKGFSESDITNLFDATVEWGAVFAEAAESDAVGEGIFTHIKAVAENQTGLKDGEYNVGILAKAKTLKRWRGYADAAVAVLGVNDTDQSTDVLSSAIWLVLTTSVGQPSGKISEASIRSIAPSAPRWIQTWFSNRGNQGTLAELYAEAEAQNQLGSLNQKTFRSITWLAPGAEIGQGSTEDFRRYRIALESV